MEIINNRFGNICSKSDKEQWIKGQRASVAGLRILVSALKSGKFAFINFEWQSSNPLMAKGKEEGKDKGEEF